MVGFYRPWMSDYALLIRPMALVFSPLPLGQGAGALVHACAEDALPAGPTG